MDLTVVLALEGVLIPLAFCGDRIVLRDPAEKYEEAPFSFSLSVRRSRDGAVGELKDNFDISAFML